MEKKIINLHIYGLLLLNPYKTVVSHLNLKRKTEAMIKSVINPPVPPVLYTEQSRALECSKGHALLCENLVGRGEQM